VTEGYFTLLRMSHLLCQRSFMDWIIVFYGNPLIIQQIGLYSITIYDSGGNCWATSTMVSVGSYSVMPCILCVHQLNGQMKHIVNVLFEVLCNGRYTITHFLICEVQSLNCWLICKDSNNFHWCQTGLLLLLVFTHLESDAGKLNIFKSINSIIYSNMRRPQGPVMAPAKAAESCAELESNLPSHTFLHSLTLSSVFWFLNSPNTTHRCAVAWKCQTRIGNFSTWPVFLSLLLCTLEGSILILQFVLGTYFFYRHTHHYQILTANWT
jgi:hypothetical protein